MASANVIDLDPKTIKVGWRARQDYGDLKELAASIKQVGQLQPIIVRKAKGGYVIIAGLRRTRACRLLGIKVKATVIAPKDEEHNLLTQLHENVKRKNFDRLEVGEGLKRFRVVYEKAHPEVKHGARGKGRGKGDGVERFTAVAARELSVGESLVRTLLKIAELPEEEKEQIEVAKTTSQRNRAATAAVSKARKKEREEKLEKKVKEKQKERRKEPAAKKEKARTIFFSPCKFEDSIATGAMPQVDLICTDPPYELRRTTLYRTQESTHIAEKVDWDKLDIGWVRLCAPFLAKGGSFITFCPLEVIGEYKAIFQSINLVYRGAIVWHKSNPPPAHRKVYIPSVEAIVWATGKGSYYFPEWDNAGTRSAHNVIEGPLCHGDERLDHPTQKPLWLMKRLLERHSAKGDRVWDPFCGTGTTLVACKKMGRIGYGNESLRKYAKLAVMRLKAL